VLSGVRSLAVHDDDVAQPADLAAQVRTQLRGEDAAARMAPDARATCRSSFSRRRTSESRERTPVWPAWRS
jgi:hypothetical protein